MERKVKVRREKITKTITEYLLLNDDKDLCAIEDLLNAHKISEVLKTSSVIDTYIIQNDIKDTYKVSLWED